MPELPSLAHACVRIYSPPASAGQRYAKYEEYTTHPARKATTDKRAGSPAARPGREAARPGKLSREAARQAKRLAYYIIWYD